MQHVSVTHPQVRGLLQDSDLQQILWKQEFSKLLGKKFDEKKHCLAMTVQPNLPDVVQERYLEVVFEDMEFDSHLQASTHSMI